MSDMDDARLGEVPLMENCSLLYMREEGDGIDRFLRMKI